MKLDSLLLEQPMMIKLSVVESPNGQQLEQDFGKLAYAFLKDRAPKLLPSMIGFEIVESNQDGSKVVGIFGFKIGTGIYYVPVFFLNNQIKGMVEIYSRDSDSYVPLRESWINHIVTRQSLDLGEPAEGKVRDSFSVPDFSVMANPPQLGSGGVKSSNAVELMADLKQHFIKVAGDTIRMLETDPQIKAMLTGALGAIKGAGFDKKANAKNSALINFIKTAGGPVYAKALATMLRNPGFAKSASVFYDFRDLLVTEFDARLEPVKTAGDKVTVVTQANSPCCTPVSSDDDKKKLIRQGFYIDDKRGDDEKAEAFDFVSEDRITNPTEPGIYHVAMTAGVNTCNVVMPNMPSFGNRMVVVFDADGNYFTANSRRVFVNGDKITPEGKTSVYDQGKAADSMKIGETYMLINADMKASVPFTVESIVEGGDAQRYVINYLDNVRHDQSSDDAGRLSCADNYYNYPKTSNINLYLSPSAGQLRATQDSLLVPDQSWKAVKLNNPDNYEARKSMERAFAPASYAEIMESMFNTGTHDVKVDSKDDGLSYTLSVDSVIDKENQNFKAACVRLVKHYGLPVDTAEIMLKEAATHYKSRRLVKFAEIPMNVTNPQMPSPQDGGFDQTLGIPVQNPQVEYTQGQTSAPPAQPSGPGSGINIGGEAQRQQASGGSGASNTTPGQAGNPADNMDVNQLAQQASQSGQQQVFDQTAIGGMARVYDTNNMIDSFIPDYMKSLDKLGRLIFMFYWKNEDFAERFGSEDMPALEDSLGSNFKNFGDLILKLKQKTVTNEDRFYI